MGMGPVVWSFSGNGLNDEQHNCSHTCFMGTCFCLIFVIRICVCARVHTCTGNEGEGIAS